MISTDFLEEYTHRDNNWWMATVQKLIQKHSQKSNDPNHDETNAMAWVAELTKIIHDSMPPILSPSDAYDGNMRLAATVSQILALWYCRVQRAKYLSPARPIDLRMRANKRWLQYIHAMVDNFVDERRDASYFPDQQWEFPFTREATSGSFV